MFFLQKDERKNICLTIIVFAVVIGMTEQNKPQWVQFKKENLTLIQKKRPCTAWKLDFLH
jgi:hypothetical protein